jgi:hypothetical protein
VTGKYGNLLKKARGQNSEAERTSEPSSPQEKHGLTETSSPVDSSINESTSSNTANQKAVKPETKLDVNTENTLSTETVKEKEVSLTIKVPISWRQHWVAECKRSGKTLKEVVTEMLAEKYGKP